jgi:hypothetical protein
VALIAFAAMSRNACADETMLDISQSCQSSSREGHQAGPPTVGGKSEEGEVSDAPTMLALGEYHVTP